MNFQEQIIPDKVSFWWMRENFTFVELKGNSIDEIIDLATAEQIQDNFGMLCGPYLSIKDKPFKKLSCVVHGEHWTKRNLESWKDSVMDNDDIKRLLQMESKMSLDKIVNEIFAPHALRIKEHAVHQILKEIVEIVYDSIEKNQSQEETLRKVIQKFKLNGEIK